jgi:TonB family protein
MPKNLRFWTNVALIAAAHVAIIIGLIHWSRAEKDNGAQSIVWMNGGAGDGIVAEKKIPPPIKSPAPRKESKTEALKDRELDEDRPFLASAPSEIQMPTPTANPARTPSPRSTSTPKPTASPKVKGTPKPKPKPTAKPTPKPTPKPSPKKVVLAKASPKPSAKPTPEEEENEPAEGPIEKIAKEESPKTEPKKTAATQTGHGKGTTAGSGSGHAGGSVNESQFGWYGSMLHDRFYSEWAQPTTVASAGGKNSVLVKLRIEKDGRVSSFEIVRPSGSAELDESVKAAASRVTKVEPLPDGLGKGDHYDVKINFELNSE